MKLKVAWFLIGCACFGLITGCTSQSHKSPTSNATPAARSTAIFAEFNTSTPSFSILPPSLPAPTAEAAQPTSLPSPTPTVQATIPPPTPTSQASSVPVVVNASQFNTIALGDYVSLTKPGGISFWFKINQVITGPAAAKKLAKFHLPQGLQWVLLETEMDYDQGPTNTAIQLLKEDEFRIISNGQVMPADYSKSYAVSNHLDYIKISPGQQSIGYLLFAVSAQDQNPVLRFMDQSQTLPDQNQTYFFSLTPSAPASTPLQLNALPFGSNGVGSANNPVPMGQTVAYQWNGSKLLFTVRQVEWGFDVSKMLWDIGRIARSPGPGQDYLMPELQIVASDPVEFQSSLFTVLNNNKTVSRLSTSCKYPCLADITLYPGGTAQGWLPFFTNQNSKTPLLSFNNQLYFSLSAASTVQAAAPATSQSPAIGYNTINKVAEAGEMAQHAVVQALAFSPDNRLLASGGDDHKIHIWEVDRQNEITMLVGQSAAIKYLSFSGDGKMLASVGSDDQVIIWNVSNWSILQKLTQVGNGIFGQFIPDGSLVTVNQAGVITVWDQLTGKIEKSYLTQKNINDSCTGSSLYSFDISPDGKSFAAALTCGFGVVWDPASGARLATVYNNSADTRYKPSMAQISVSDSLGLAAYASTYHQHWGYLIDVLDTNENYVLGSIGTAAINVPAIAFAPNGQVIAAGIGNTVRTWWPSGYDWMGKNRMDLVEHSSQVTSIKFSQDGTLLASGDYSGKIVLWKVTP